MDLHALARRQHPAVLRFAGVVERRHVGGRRRRRRPHQHFHHPFAAQHRRRPIGERGLHEDAALAEEPATRVVGIRHASELIARHALKTIMTRQALVDERVVGSIEIEDAAILAHEAVEEQFRLAAHRGGEVVVEIRIEVRIGMNLLDVLQSQPLRGESRSERIGPRIGQHAPSLLLKCRAGQLPLSGQREQLLIGRRAPQEERQARRKIRVGDAICAARPHVAGLALQTEDEMRAREDRLEGRPHATFEALLRRASLVERQQTIDLVAAERPAVCLGAETRDDLTRARLLFVRQRRPAREDLLAARRVRNSGDLERSVDDQIADMRQRRDARTAGSAAGERPVVRADQIFVRPFEAANERSRNLMLPRAHQNRLRAHATRAAPVGAAGRLRLVLEQRHALAVDRDVDVLEPRVRSRVERHLEHVFRVSGKHVIDHEAAARPERRAVDVIPRMLRHVARRGVDGIDRRRMTIADGHAADRRRRVQICLEQRRRQRLRVGDVVEVGALLIERQPVARIDVERQKILDGARVFRPVETLERAHAGVRLRGGGGIDRRLDRRDERLLRGSVGTRRERRWHQAGLQLADDLFARLRVLGRARDIERLE